MESRTANRTITALSILVVASLLRLPLLNGSFWLDEAAQALEIVRPLSEQFSIVEDFQPPLLHLVLHAAQYVSREEWFLRLIGALIPGIVTVFATYQIGKILGGPRVASIAALLLATSSFHIFYSQELRPYALPAMIGTLSWWRILLWQKQKPRVFDPYFCLLTFFGLFSTYLYPFLLLSQIAYVLAVVPTSRKQIMGSVALAGIGFLPWLPFFIGQFHQGSTVQLLLPGWASVVGIPQLKSLPLVAVKFLFGVANVEPSLFFIGGMAVVTLTSLPLLRHLTKEHQASLKPIICWLLLPLLTAWLISFLVPILQPKRVLYSLPALYVALAYIVEQGLRKKQRAAVALLATLLAINTISTASYYFQPALQRENWRALHQQLVQQYPKETSVAVFAFPKPFAPWEWYDDGTYPTASLGTLGTTNPEKVNHMLAPLLDGRYQYILVFDYLRDITDPSDLIPKFLADTGFEERDTIDYPNIGFVRVFARKEAATAYEYRY